VIEELARNKADDLGLHHQGRSLREVVRSIQAREGYEECFDSGRRTCPHEACCWRESCLGRALAQRAFELNISVQEVLAQDALEDRAAQRFDRRLRRLEELGV
jgi:DNA-binding IscR family transcriptional regulator